ncbi:hypothetical protein [Gottschalkia acidurici]|uniref:hypothetical protein n=1 Tax=Clostridium acidurici TaxID=1556 RepID=UPI0002D945DE|nr:hypothetical protein [Gottschalkia acidurici]
MTLKKFFTITLFITLTLIMVYCTTFTYKLALVIKDIANLSPLIAFSIFLILFMNISFLFNNFKNIIKNTEKLS